MGGLPALVARIGRLGKGGQAAHGRFRICLPCLGAVSGSLHDAPVGFRFFEFANFEALDNLLGVPGAEIRHSVGSETPLMTEDPYANVRHPMYRAAFFLTFSSLLIALPVRSGTFVRLTPSRRRRLAPVWEQRMPAPPAGR